MLYRLWHQGKAQMNKAVRTDIKVGSTVYYTLAENLLPTNPTKVWKGRVAYTHSPLCQFLIVESLEPGYEGEYEPVFLDQIVSIEKGAV